MLFQSTIEKIIESLNLLALCLNAKLLLATIQPYNFLKKRLAFKRL